VGAPSEKPGVRDDVTQRQVTRERRQHVAEQEFEQSGWTLRALLNAHEGPEFDETMADLEARVSLFEVYREQLSPDVANVTFRAVLELAESIISTVSRLVGYAHLWFAEDTQSQEALAFVGSVNQLAAEIRNRMLFFELWWKGLEDGPAERLLAVSGDNAYYLESLRRFKPHTLAESEERIINLKDVNGVDALVDLYDVITNRFSFHLVVDGEMTEMTRAELSTYVRDPSPEMRAAAYQELFRVYSAQATILGKIYNHVVRDWASENLSLRAFDTPVSVRNLANDIPDPAVATLLSVCRDNTTLFHRLFRLKAAWLGQERLRRYDVYAPIGAVEKSYTFSEAVDLVLDSLGRFSGEMANRARRVFTSGHIDSEIRPGKRGGAFCAGVLPEVTPWVMTNYVGKIEDVATMAHELGHAIHAILAEDHTVFTFRASLPLAETASVFSEMLLTDYLLSEEADRDVRRQLLARVLDDAYATIARQAYFVLFEQEAHRRVLEGATVDDLCELYLHNLAEQFGDAVEVTDDFRWEWTAIPHIYHTPFYCYAYSFGHLLVMSLYQQYRSEGKSFVPRFLRTLRYGGSRSPEQIISEAGFEMASRGFWEGGFRVLEDLLTELETL
jgi:oligoendopeptidase F